ncbi:MAG: chemotaxis-specific protein-glutamate methyltransferase CheB [Amphiplicatus sp.]
MKTPPRKPIRVLIVEDSPTALRLLQAIIAADPRLDVAGAASSGEAALAMLDNVRPDVITMDIKLPGIDGLETTKRIMKRRPTPIIVVAAVASEAQARISMSALKAGALAIIEKPRGVASADFDEIALRLRRQITLMSDVKLVRQRRAAAPVSRPPGRPLAAPFSGCSAIKAVGIAASTGGPNAILEILRGIARDFPAPILVVQHITPSFVESFAGWLGAAAPAPVEIATHGAIPRPGRVYIAPGDGVLEYGGARLTVLQGEAAAAKGAPANALFRSLARNAGADCIAVLLTGMGDDGAQGMRAAFDAGAHTIAEDEATAVVYGMPAAAVACGAAREQLPLPQIAPRLNQIAAGRARVAS